MITVFVNTHADKNEYRNAELTRCDELRRGNPFHETVNLEGKRHTHSDHIRAINQMCSAGEIALYCNSDIFFDESIKFLENIKENEVYCLSRWDIGKDGSSRLFNRADSQDVWAFRTPIREIEVAEFHLGKPGCDNRIAYLLKQSGYVLRNPSKTIRCHHLHLSGIRNYISKGHVERIPGPYELIAPHEL